MNETNINEIARDERRAYFREWRKKNKDKVSQNNKRYWENRALKKIQAEEDLKGGERHDGANEND